MHDPHDGPMPMDFFVWVAADVDTVIATYLHWDREGSFYKFPQAHLHLQKWAIQHAVGPTVCSPFLRRLFDIEQICLIVHTIYRGRITFHDGEEGVPGIAVDHVGEHTAGLQIVQIMAQHGWVVVASDVMHYHDTGEIGTPFPVLINVVEYLAALSLVRHLAEPTDHIIAGHDPAVLKMYPAVSPQLENIALRLDVMPQTQNR